MSFEARMRIAKPELIQLYSSATPNGIKVAAALEEIKLLRSTTEEFDYEPHTINIRSGESRCDEFSKISPTGKIPAICDPHGADGKHLHIFESGAILLYLAEKYHELLSDTDLALRSDAIKWLFWGSSAISSQIKLFGFYYKYCPHNIPYCIGRYAKECNRLLGVLEYQLQHGKDWVIGDMYTIADISIWPWMNALYENYGDAPSMMFNNFKAYPLVVAWYHRCMARPASQKSLHVTTFMFEK